VSVFRVQVVTPSGYGRLAEADTLEGICNQLEKIDDAEQVRIDALGGTCVIEMLELRALVARSVTIHGRVFE
jgi:hypothetical protein